MEGKNRCFDCITTSSISELCFNVCLDFIIRTITA